MWLRQITVLGKQHVKGDTLCTMIYIMWMAEGPSILELSQYLPTTTTTTTTTTSTTTTTRKEYMFVFTLIKVQKLKNRMFTNWYQQMNSPILNSPMHALAIFNSFYQVFAWTLLCINVLLCTCTALIKLTLSKVIVAHKFWNALCLIEKDINKWIHPRILIMFL